MIRSIWLCIILSLSSFGLRAQQTPYVILVSFDGFRYDYVAQYKPPNFLSFIQHGSQAEALIPVFPSKTFPNHYSLVTGLYPGHHGLVDNYFFDLSRSELYTMKSKERVGDPYYYNGVPLWKLAQQQGVKSASYFWVGSEIPLPGWHPDYYFSYDGSVPFEARVDKVLEWLTLPEKDRPHFITLYFSSPDQESDDHGPISEETRQGVLGVDALLGRLMTGLAKLNLPVNVILVSDHGASELTVTKDAFIFLDELLDLKNSSIKVANGGSQVHLYANNNQQLDSLYHFLLTKKNHFDVLRRKDFPARWHYNNDRSGDLLIVAEPGYNFRDGNRPKFMQTIKEGDKLGMHGYDPYVLKDMQGIFYAQGPNIKQGKIIPAFENIHIYLLIARILKLTTPPTDGDENVLKQLYKE
ncbi:MAG TPA: ectonucleotide pyrophosphatase/phosphodiesterase [Cyclobacteriaceae bacterium]|nr:ectonucleotide pyrophosphatase/phosphodiesterase [Cyclobacteriaceae bacterium]